jgi:hypothetical protein
MGGKLVLINSVLSSLPMFMLSFFRILRKCVRDWIILDPLFLAV